VTFESPRADAHAKRTLLVGAAFADQGENLAFPSGQRLLVGVRRQHHVGRATPETAERTISRGRAIRRIGAGDVTVASGAILKMQNGTNNDYIFDGASLSIASDSTVNLNFSGAPDIVGFLVIDGVSQPAGLYGGPGSPAPHILPQFTGVGEILVTTPVAISRRMQSLRLMEIFALSRI
jgi:hypothetical protein